MAAQTGTLAAVDGPFKFKKSLYDWAGQGRLIIHSNPSLIIQVPPLDRNFDNPGI